jgi:hypothetical protein
MAPFYRTGARPTTFQKFLFNRRVLEKTIPREMTAWE